MPILITETDTFDPIVYGPQAGDPRTAASVRAMGAPLADRTRFLYNRQTEVFGQYLPLGGVSPAAVAGIVVNVSSNVAVTFPGHGLSGGECVRFVFASTDALLPSPLATGAVYFVDDIIDGNSFHIARTSGEGGAWPTSTSGALSGTVYCLVVNDAAASLFVPYVASTGVSMNPGTLRSHLDNFARLDGNSGTQLFNGIVEFVQPVKFMRGGNQMGLWSRSEGTITPGIGAVTLPLNGGSYPVYVCDQSVTGTGTALIVTLGDYPITSIAPTPEISILFIDVLMAGFTIKNSGGTVLYASTYGYESTIYTWKVDLMWRNGGWRVTSVAINHYV